MFLTLSSVFSILIGVIEIIASIIDFLYVKEVSSVATYYDKIIFINIFIDILLIILATMALCKKYYLSTVLVIAVLIILSLLFIFQFYGVLINYKPFFIFKMLLIFITLSLKVLELCFTDKNALKGKSLGSKIQELKYLKDIGVINDEQYAIAVSDIISKL